MDFKTQNTTQQPQGTAPASSRPSGGAQGSSRGKLLTLVVSAVVVVLVVVAGLVAWQMKGSSATGSGVDENGYQALFMTNGQVYFGHLANLEGGYTELTDVYYLQVQQSVQPATDAKTDSEQPQVSLTKLGNELHGPKDKMYVSKDQVLFWENLKDDSTVVKAIKDYQAKQ